MFARIFLKNDAHRCSSQSFVESSSSRENSHDRHCKKPTIANRLNVTRKIAVSGDAAWRGAVVRRSISTEIVNTTHLATLMRTAASITQLFSFVTSKPLKAPRSFARITSFNEAGCAAGSIKIAGNLID